MKFSVVAIFSLLSAATAWATPYPDNLDLTELYGTALGCERFRLGEVLAVTKTAPPPSEAEALKTGGMVSPLGLHAPGLSCGFHHEGWTTLGAARLYCRQRFAGGPEFIRIRYTVSRTNTVILHTDHWGSFEFARCPVGTWSLDQRKEDPRFLGHEFGTAAACYRARFGGGENAVATPLQGEPAEDPDKTVYIGESHLIGANRTCKVVSNFDTTTLLECSDGEASWTAIAFGEGYNRDVLYLEMKTMSGDLNTLRDLNWGSGIYLSCDRYRFEQ